MLVDKYPDFLTPQWENRHILYCLPKGLPDTKSEAEKSDSSPFKIKWGFCRIQQCTEGHPGASVQSFPIWQDFVSAHSTVPYSLWPHRLVWAFPNKNTVNRLPFPPGDLLDQGSNLNILPHLFCRQILLILSHQGSPFDRRSHFLFTW